MNEPVIFVGEAGPLRTELVDGEPWFVASDVSAVLGYRMASDMTRTLDPDERGTRQMRTPSGDQNVTVISEAGLYTAIMQRQTGRIADDTTRAQIKTFQRWVTHEVLPKIRRTGQFGSEIPTSFAEALELAAAKQRAIEAAEAKILADAPKVAAYDALMDAEGYYSMDAAAKVAGVGRNTLFRKLRDDGVLQRGSNLPYQRWAHHFIVTASTWQDREGVDHLAHTTRVRPSGLAFIAKRYGKPAAELVKS